MAARKIGVVARHNRGALTAVQLNATITRTWEALLASEVGRRQIAAALGVKLEDIQPQELKQSGPPFSVDGASGADITTLSVMGDWMVTTIVVPVLIDLVKDEAKERLTRLWKAVVLPRLQSENAIKDAVS